MAVVARVVTGALLALAALSGMGVGPNDPRALLTEFDRVITAMAFAAAGLAVFAIVWAGVVLMAEGTEERGSGRAKSAVFGAVVGLVLVLSAKAVALALLSQVHPIS